MKLTNEQVKQFQTLYKKELGVAIDAESAKAAGTAIVQLVDAIIEPNDHVRRNKRATKTMEERAPKI